MIKEGHIERQDDDGATMKIRTGDKIKITNPVKAIPHWYNWAKQFIGQELTVIKADIYYNGTWCVITKEAPPNTNGEWFWLESEFDHIPISKYEKAIDILKTKR